jgi:hypothetical protein
MLNMYDMCSGSYGTTARVHIASKLRRRINITVSNPLKTMHAIYSKRLGLISEVLEMSFS